MASILPLFILIPLLGFIGALIAPKQKENLISAIAFSAVGAHTTLTTGFLIWWALSGFPSLNIKELVLYKSHNYEFFIALTFDRITASFLFVGSILSFLVTVYSRYYLHRENGYKRFFNTKLLFYAGYNIAIFSGNMETLFVGWEILGITSFLLIAFYRDRYLPVKNAVKVFSIYRIGDVGIILAMWMSHHLWHENITFAKLANYQLVSQQLESHTLIGFFISSSLLLAAAAKSAQLPFSSWLPRAMEGPTPSSAIFYGSLSVNMGIFLLLRTFPFWEHQIPVRILIGLLGFITSFVATGIARVQSTVKSQVAYASISQLGLMFIEIALGWHTFALIHFAGNAFLRTYQLLVSPSVVSYLIREQSYVFTPKHWSIEDYFPKKLENTLYILCLKEWSLDSFMYRFLWNPLKWGARKLDFLSINKLILFFIPAYSLGILAWFFQEQLPRSFTAYIPVTMAIVGVLMVLKSFAERKHVRMSWMLVVMNHCWIALAIYFNEHFSITEVIFYLSGVLVAGAIGLAALYRLKFLEGNIDLDRFHGHIYEHPKIGRLFLLACLGVAGFPITPSFIGEDLIFSHIHENQLVLASLVSLSFIIDGLAIIRIYARIFLGPHSKPYHEVAYRSA